MSQVGIIEYFLMVVGSGDIHLASLGKWVCLLLSCVTNRKDSHKGNLRIIMRYYIDLQVLDTSIVS